MKAILSVFVKEKKFMYHKDWVRVVFVYHHSSVFCAFVPLYSKLKTIFRAKEQLPGKSDKLGSILVHVCDRAALSAFLKFSPSLLFHSLPASPCIAPVM